MTDWWLLNWNSLISDPVGNTVKTYSSLSSFLQHPSLHQTHFLHSASHFYNSKKTKLTYSAVKSTDTVLAIEGSNDTSWRIQWVSCKQSLHLHNLHSTGINSSSGKDEWKAGCAEIRKTHLKPCRARHMDAHTSLTLLVRKFHLAPSCFPVQPHPQIRKIIPRIKTQSISELSWELLLIKVQRDGNIPQRFGKVLRASLTCQIIL